MSGQFTIRRPVKDYSKYNLKANPFPASPVPPESPRIFADQEKAKELIGSLINDIVYGGKKPIHSLIIARYGNGKSHTLKVIRTSIVEQLYPDNLAIAGYIPRTGGNFLSLYRGFMRDLGIDFFEDLALKVRNWIMETGDLATEIQNIGRYESKIISYLYKRLSDSDLATALVKMFYSDESFRIAFNWICGEWINLFTLRNYGIVNRIDSDEKALSTFINFRKLIETLGIKMIFVCIDEFENIIYLSANDRVRLLESLRHIIDWNPTGMTLLVSCSPEALDSIIAYPPLDRLAMQIRLDDLTGQNVNAYVEAYLVEQRIDTTKTGLFPFDRDIIGQLFGLLQVRMKANVRNLLKISHFALDIALEMGKDRIDDDVVKELEKKSDIYLG